jgi:hypothetical protein
MLHSVCRRGGLPPPNGPSDQAQKRSTPVCLVCGGEIHHTGTKNWCLRCGLLHTVTPTTAGWLVAGAELGQAGCRRDRRRSPRIGGGE